MGNHLDYCFNRLLWIRIDFIFVLQWFNYIITFLNKAAVTLYCRRISKDTCSRYLEVTWIQFGFVKVHPWPGPPIVHAGPIGSWWLLGICWLRLESNRWGHHCQNCTSFFDCLFFLTCAVVGRPKVPPQCCSRMLWRPGTQLEAGFIHYKTDIGVNISLHLCWKYVSHWWDIEAIVRFWNLDKHTKSKPKKLMDGWANRLETWYFLEHQADG
jgi:hypothetical protein